MSERRLSECVFSGSIPELELEFLFLRKLSSNKLQQKIKDKGGTKIGADDEERKKGIEGYERFKEKCLDFIQKLSLRRIT